MDTRYATCLADLLAPCPDTGRQPLNEAQHRAVVASDEPQLVLAGPGTGKTRVLVYRAAYLLLRERDRLRPQEIGLFTYTNKAARQLRARLFALVGPDAQYVRAGTLHHFAYSLVREHAERLGLEEGFAVADSAVLLPFWEAWCKEQRGDWKPPDVQGRISLAKLGLGTLSGVLVPARHQYDDWLRRRRLLDYDDLLLFARDLVVQHADVRRAIRGGVRALLIDEFQDTDQVQYTALARIAGREGTGLYCVADDDQSIYGFRGAWPRNVRKYMDEFGCERGGDRLHVLNRNYRSVRSIFRCAESVLAQGDERLKRIGDVDVAAGDDENRPVRVVACATENREHGFAVEEVMALLDRGVPAASIAVLAPFNGRLDTMERLLLQVGIPCETSGGGRLTEQPVMRRLRPLWAYLHEQIVAGPRSGDGVLADEWLGVLAEAVLPPHAYGTLASRARDAQGRGMDRPFQQTLWHLASQPPDALGADEKAELDYFASVVLNLTERARQDGATVGALSEAALALWGTSVSVLSDSLGVSAPCGASVSEAAGALRAALGGAKRVVVRHTDPRVARLWQLVLREVLSERRREDAAVPTKVEVWSEGMALMPGDVVIADGPASGGLWGAPTFVLCPERVGASPLPAEVWLVDTEGVYESAAVRLFRLLQETFACEARPLYDRYAMVDVEATSVYPKECRVVELAALRVEGGEVVDRFEQLIALPEDLTGEEAETLRAVCGFDLERDFEDAVPMTEAWAAFSAFVAGAPLVAHNGQLYDFRVLDRLAKEHGGVGGRTWTFAHDMLPDARVLFPSLASHSAESLRRELLEEARPTRHRALADCEDQQRILERLQVERARRSTRLQFEGALAAVVVAAAFEPETRVGDTESEEASLLHAGMLHLLRGDAGRAGRISKALGGGVTGATVVQRSRPLARLLLARLGGQGLSGTAPSTRARLGALLAPYAELTVAEGGLADLVGELALWGDETSPAAVVTLSTYHSAKGLEFEHVYCLGASQGCFPMRRDAGDREKVSESRRVLYVGMTRAERSLTVTYAERNRWDKPSGPSAFLSGLPAEHHERVEA